MHRWVRKFGPEIAKRSQKHRGWRGLGWHVDETYLRVDGRWCFVWRAVDQRGQLFQARDKSRLYQPLSIVTDKAPTYARVMKEINARMLPDEAITHIDRKWQNNRIESDHAALKQRLNPMRGFKSLSSAKAALAGIEALRMIKKGHVVRKSPGPIGEIRLSTSFFQKRHKRIKLTLIVHQRNRPRGRGLRIIFVGIFVGIEKNHIVNMLQNQYASC